MALSQWIVLALKLSIFLLVFALGLQTNIRNVGHLFARPGKFLRSVLAMNVLMPLFAVALAAAAPLSYAVKVMLVAVALAPMPPALPRKESKAGGEESYAIGLLFTAACLSIVTIPLAMEVLERAFRAPLSMAPGKVAQIILTTTFAPLGAGLAVRAIAPSFAGRISEPVARVAGVTLPLAALALLFGFRHAIVAEFSFNGVGAITAFVLFGLGVGHVLGGDNPADRTVLALSTATRHPGMALAIASGNFPQKRDFIAALFLYLVVSALLSMAYLAVRRMRAARETDAAAA